MPCDSIVVSVDDKHRKSEIFTLSSIFVGTRKCSLLIHICITEQVRKTVTMSFNELRHSWRHQFEPSISD
jgi:hypothetical protein